MTRRQVGKRRRPVQRLTPRRWLPFLALSALVAGAVVVTRHHHPPDLTAQAAQAQTASIVPSVAPDQALSTAWFCGGGTARGAGGLAEMVLVIANDANQGATADLTVYDDAGHQATAHVAVPADGRVRIDAATIRTGQWVAATVEVRGGRAVVEREVHGPDGFGATPCATGAGDHWYVPSGSTLRGAEEYLTVFNPFPDPASVDVTFATDTGLRTPASLSGFSIPGGALRTIRVADTVHDRSRVAAEIVARTGRVVVDRVQTYDGTGDTMAGSGPDAVTTPPPHGLVSTPALLATASRWFFPGTVLGSGTRSQVAVFNPTAQAAAVNVTVAFQNPELNASVEPIQLTVPPNSQVTVDLTDQVAILPGINFTIDVDSLAGVGIVSERLAFVGAPAARRGAAVVSGSPVAATRWIVAQAGSTRYQAANVIVANPGGRAAHLHVIELTRGTRREVRSADIEVPAHDRRPLVLDGISPSAALEITSDQPVVVADGISLSKGPGLSLALGEPFPEAVTLLPPSS